MFGNTSKIIYCKINSFGFSAGCFDITRIGCTTCQDHAVKFLQQLFGFDIHTDIHTGLKYDAFFGQHVYFSFNDSFFQFHIWDTIHQKSARTVGTLKHSNTVSTFVELVSRCQSRRTGANDRYFFTRPYFRRFCLHQSVGIAVFNDRIFIFLNCDRTVIQTTGTCSFTRCRAHAGSKFRKIVCFQKSSQCFFVIIQIQKIIPFRTHIVQWTSRSHSSDHHAGLTKRNTTIHTSGCLFLSLLVGHRNVKFVEVLYSLKWCDLFVSFTFIF